MGTQIPGEYITEMNNALILEKKGKQRWTSQKLFTSEEYIIVNNVEQHNLFR